MLPQNNLYKQGVTPANHQHFSGIVAVLLCVLVVSIAAFSPAHAQSRTVHGDGNFDVAGVKLGMSYKEAASALAAYFKIQYPFIPDEECLGADYDDDKQWQACRTRGTARMKITHPHAAKSDYLNYRDCDASGKFALDSQFNTEVNPSSIVRPITLFYSNIKGPSCYASSICFETRGRAAKIDQWLKRDDNGVMIMNDEPVVQVCFDEKSVVKAVMYQDTTPESPLERKNLAEKYGVSSPWGSCGLGKFQFCSARGRPGGVLSLER